MDAIDLETATVEAEALAAMSESCARVYRVLPLRFENGKRDLIVATAEPLSLPELDDLAFMSSCIIVPVKADEQAVEAAIDRHYADAWYEKALREMECLDSRPAWRRALAFGVAWLKRLFRRIEYPPHVIFAYRLLTVAADANAREAVIEHSRRDGLFYMLDASSEGKEFPLPPKMTRRIVRRVMELAEIKPRRGSTGGEGSFQLNIRDKEVSYAVTSERTEDGERVRFRLTKTRALSAHEVSSL